jgi:hypothetical protein
MFRRYSRLNFGENGHRRYGHCEYYCDASARH